jgi:hypothetical protein
MKRPEQALACLPGLTNNPTYFGGSAVADSNSNSTHPVVTRKQAKALGLVRYFTGKPCPHGHIAQRFTSYGQCEACTVASRDAWYHANKPRAAVKNAEWMKANIGRKRQINAAWRARHPEQAKAAVDAHYAANPEMYAAYRKRWQAANPDKMRAFKDKWKAENPHKVAADGARRSAAKLNATPAWSSQASINNYYTIAAFLTAELGVPFEVDHIVPLRSQVVCGLHAHTNLSISLASWNRSKSNRWWPDMPEPERHRCDVGMLA